MRALRVDGDIGKCRARRKPGVDGPHERKRTGGLINGKGVDLRPAIAGGICELAVRRQGYRRRRSTVRIWTPRDGRECTRGWIYRISGYRPVSIARRVREFAGRPDGR